MKCKTKLPVKHAWGEIKRVATNPETVTRVPLVVRIRPDVVDVHLVLVAFEVEPVRVAINVCFLRDTPQPHRR